MINLYKNLNDKGITLAALIITVIIMLILAGLGFSLSGKAMEKAKLEDLRTNMLLLQGRAKTIYEKYSFKDIEELVGVEIDPENNSYSGYTVPAQLKTTLSSNSGTYYIFEQADLNSNGLSTIKVDTTSFYIVNYESGEIYYSLGYTVDNTTYYSLTELKAL